MHAEVGKEGMRCLKNLPPNLRMRTGAPLAQYVPAAKQQAKLFQCTWQARACALLRKHEEEA